MWHFQYEVYMQIQQLLWDKYSSPYRVDVSRIQDYKDIESAIKQKKMKADFLLYVENLSIFSFFLQFWYESLLEQ